MSKAARNSLKLSLFTIVSRILGLLRDHYQAVFFGTGPIAAAWEVAYMLPNMLRNLLAEGVMSQAFIPIYSDALKESRALADRKAATVLGFLFLAISAIVLVGILVFPYVIPLYTDTSGSEADLMVALSRIMFGFILTASLTAILAGIANTHGEFSVPALSPILLNLVFIGGFLILSHFEMDDFQYAKILAWVVIGGGIGQFLLQTLYLKYRNWWPGFRFTFDDPVIKKIFSLMAPAVLGAGLFHINQLLDIALASYFIPDTIGAIPALRYSQRLIQLPTGVIGVALSTTILPALARAIREGSGHKNGEELISALNFSLFLTVPAAFGMGLLGTAILNLLYFGGAWNAQSTVDTWMALQFYVIGIPFYSANRILTSSFYAYQDTKTPVRILIKVVVVNFLLNLILVHFLYQGGIALSSAVTSVLNGTMLLFALRRKMGQLPIERLFRFLGKVLPLWILSIAVLLAIQFFATSYLDQFTLYIFGGGQLFPRYSGLVHVVVGILSVLIIYLPGAILLRVEEVSVFTDALKRKIAPRGGN